MFDGITTTTISASAGFEPDADRCSVSEIDVLLSQEIKNEFNRIFYMETGECQETF